MTKPEIRKNDEVRMTKARDAFIRVSSFVIRISFGFRVSSFGFPQRVSSFGLSPLFEASGCGGGRGGGLLEGFAVDAAHGFGVEIEAAGAFEGEGVELVGLEGAPDALAVGDADAKARAEGFVAGEAPKIFPERG